MVNSFKKNFYLSLFFLTALLIYTLKTEAVIIDRIMAKINNEIIAQSELEEQLDSLREELLQNHKPEEVDNDIKNRKTELFGKMIEAKLMLQEAKRLNVAVGDDEIDKEVEKNIKQLKNNFPDETKYLEALQQKGLNPDTFKEKLEKNVSENMTIQHLIFREVRSQIDVTESDIREYFLHIGEETHARHILIKLLPDSDSKQEKEALEKINSIYKELTKGVDFKELAKKNSEDPRASDGGDLGFFKRGDMIPEFEVVLNKLKVGEFSEPVRTRYGYHIIYIEEQKILPKEEELRASHILVKTKDEALEIKKQLLAGESFEKLAKEKSQDPSSREKGGDLGYFKKNMMIEGFGDVAFNLKHEETSDPVETKFGFHIIKAHDKRFVRYDDLHEDMKNALMQSQMEARYIKWIYNLRKFANIEIIK
ncbi:peptidylprolyl isomerase [Candidatus Poribacteria bacterium]|nr:peptidylprolyl isomerase [Candidatus Poribacteria bacterium]